MVLLHTVINSFSLNCFEILRKNKTGNKEISITLKSIEERKKRKD
jgi:hypothetical protein